MEYKDYGYIDPEQTYAHNYIAKPILTMLKSKTQCKILDLGCGNGSLTHHLISSGFDAYGIDASESGIQIAARKYPERFALQNLESEDLPDEFKAISFKTIISTEVIEHLYNPRGFVSFCKNILLRNNGGELILSTPYHGYLKNLAISLLGKWDTHANPLWDGGHIKLWSKKTITKLLEEQGFDVIDFIGCGRIPLLYKSMVVRATIGKEEKVGCAD